MLEPHNNNNNTMYSVKRLPLIFILVSYIIQTDQTETTIECYRDYVMAGENRTVDENRLTEFIVSGESVGACYITQHAKGVNYGCYDTPLTGFDPVKSQCREMCTTDPKMIKALLEVWGRWGKWEEEWNLHRNVNKFCQCCNQAGCNKDQKSIEDVPGIKCYSDQLISAKEKRNSQSYKTTAIGSKSCRRTTFHDGSIIRHGDHAACKEIGKGCTKDRGLLSKHTPAFPAFIGINPKLRATMVCCREEDLCNVVPALTTGTTAVSGGVFGAIALNTGTTAISGGVLGGILIFGGVFLH